jgi:NADPH:quinone reductase-like Zn-dependent oxidoreductase
MVSSGALILHIDRTYALSAAPEAHRALESRATTGKLLLAP